MAAARSGSAYRGGTPVSRAQLAVLTLIAAVVLVATVVLGIMRLYAA
jgi:hypothetical protein